MPKEWRQGRSEIPNAKVCVKAKVKMPKEWRQLEETKVCKDRRKVQVQMPKEWRRSTEANE
jgi:hypothetical protein